MRFVLEIGHGIVPTGLGYRCYLTGDQVNPLLQPIVAIAHVPMPPVADLFHIGGGNDRHFQFLKYIELRCRDDTAERSVI